MLDILESSFGHICEISFEVINKCQCVSSTGSKTCSSHNRATSVLDR